MFQFEEEEEEEDAASNNGIMWFALGCLFLLVVLLVAWLLP